MSDNKLHRYNPENLPAYFEKLTEEQQSAFLEKLATDRADLIKYVDGKVADSKTAEHDMSVGIDYIGRLESDNKMINIKQTYKTGSGQMDVTIRGGDRKLIIPILLILVVLIVAVLVVMFWGKS